jgi:hypothetical protein
LLRSEIPLYENTVSQALATFTLKHSLTATYRWPNFIFSLTVAALAEACSSDRVGIVRKGTACRA